MFDAFVAQFTHNFFSLTELTFLANLVIALILGYVVGAERELRGKDAGVSTHIMVICGAMLFTFISMLVDPNSTSRIASQIIPGIGFLGAGLILRDGMTVRNLTTAASLWFAAAIGMAIGYGFYLVAIVAALTAVVVPRIPLVKKAAHAEKARCPICDTDIDVGEAHTH